MVRTGLFFAALKTKGNPIEALGTIRKMRATRLRFAGTATLPRPFYSNGRLFLNPNIPGWPSAAFRRFARDEIASINGNNSGFHLHTLIMSITRRCPLRCLHCFEWDRLSGQDNLTLDDLKTIVRKYREAGICQIQLGGGEPLERMSDLVELISTFRSDIEFWLLTSGYDLTPEKANILRKAGLTGVKISLDHFNPLKHDEFRGNKNSFNFAVEAVENCRKSGLATGLAICITGEMAEEENLHQYLRLAKSLKIDFIFLLEPRETGHFRGKEVELKPWQVETVDRFYLEVSSDTKNSYPLVIYPGHHQRVVGCSGAGNRYLYIDSSGAVHACPFCQDPAGNAVTDDPSSITMKLRTRGCHAFASQA
ncbi:MAG: radical SAM protein [Bacteroidales bacterium]